MALEIPKDDAGAIAVMRALPSAALEKFISALKDAPPISSPREMAEHISKLVPSLAVEQLTTVLNTLYTLYHIRELSGVESEMFLNDLMRAIKDSPEMRDVAKGKDLSRLRTLLERLLGIEALSVVSKAARLLRDGERLYCGAKVLSDIRPVFGSDPAIKPLGAVLTHTLKVGYHEGSDHREFHVVLDSNDLASLEEAVQRARAKDATLRSVLKSTGLTNLDE
jgi:hypothetical protein